MVGVYNDLSDVCTLLVVSCMEFIIVIALYNWGKPGA